MARIPGDESSIKRKPTALFSFNRHLNYWLLLALVLVSLAATAQESDKGFLDEFRGTVSVTNNGFSIIPSFSLGEPALLTDLKFIKGRFSFEPDMRFALEGKPWSFIFWFRYQAIQKERFSLRVGAHPALNFRTISIMRNGQPEEILESRRYFAAEVVPSYKLGKNTGVGMYYFYGRGFDEGVKNTIFLVLNGYVNNIAIVDDFHVNIAPQVFFLKTDELTGYYVFGSISLVKGDFPLSASFNFNKALETEIVPEDDFTWNIALTYRFP